MGVGTVLNLGGYEGCHLVVGQGGRECPDAMVDNMLEFMLSRPKQRHPYNRKMFLRRRQGCYTRDGDKYNFGQQNPVLGDVKQDGLVEWCAAKAVEVVRALDPCLGAST